ncbi:ester cyclase [Halopenitus persicus]|uniref:ester cyclase n=1 Tax=Halopenitus persicus TaxID=1048396 RepID=UPI000BBB532C|nr:ester cyclase [Halopenitus persicus]
MSTTENKEKARRVVEAINADDMGVIDELFADDYVGRYSALTEAYHGPEGVKEFVSRFLTAFPDAEWTVEDVISEGDKVVRRDRISGTHEGEFMGIEPTGKKIEMEGIGILRVEDGQFVESWGQADTVGLVQQLGVFEPPERRHD